MQYTTIKVFIAVTLGLWNLLSFAAYANSESILVVTEEWAPFNYEEQGKLKGFSVEIVQHIIDDLNIDAQIRLYPSTRAMKMFNTNKRIMLISLMRTPERESSYHWIGPLEEGSIYFYKRKNSPLNINSLDDAKKVKSIALRQAGLVTDTLRKKGFTNLDATSSSATSIYLKLLNNRVDLAISESPLGAQHVLRKLGYPSDAMEQTPVAVVKATLYIAASKDIPETEIQQWQQALDQLKANGRYQQIRSKYYGNKQD